MRNPDRIKVVLSLLQQGWEKVPDWRFGQLIENLKRYINVADLFYVEDDKLAEQIAEFFDLNNTY